MAVTLKCPDCGHSVQAEDETPQTCPQCDGTMKKPAYKAKSAPTSSEKPKEKEKEKEKPKAKPWDEEKPKPKARPKDDDEEDDKDEKPKKKPVPKPAKKEALSLDDDEDDDAAGPTRNGKIAEGLEIDPGFKNKKLMRQVEGELGSDEVLYWAARPSLFLAKRKAGWIRIGGIAFAIIGAAIMAAMLIFGGKIGMPMAVAIVPGLFVLVGLLIAIMGPKGVVKQAEEGWYAVTDRRAIVFTVYFFGKGGKPTNYEPNELRRMWVEKSYSLEGGGSLVFKTILTRTTSTSRDSSGRARTSTSTSKEHFGFIDIENVKEVEELVHKVLLVAEDDDDDDDD